jgi:histidine triad (HIT) family protein
METSEQQIQSLKNQIINQIKTTFPEDKKDAAVQQVESMNKDQFISFLKQNNLISDSENPEKIQNLSESQGIQETPFRQIIQGSIPSYKINENDACIAVLEINPISLGHTIIIPRSPVHDVSSMPSACSELAEDLSKFFKKELNPKKVIVKPSSILGEIIINVVPIYENETLDSQRTKAKEEELEALAEVLEKSSTKKEKQEKTSENEKQKPESKEPSSETNLILPKRIP